MKDCGPSATIQYEEHRMYKNKKIQRRENALQVRGRGK